VTAAYHDIKVIIGSGYIIGSVLKNQIQENNLDTGFGSTLPESQVLIPEPINPKPRTQPSMTQPLVSPNINREIESQVPKNKNKKKGKQHKSKAQIPDEGIHTQVECPKDLSKLKCGSNCYEKGKLYKIVCSQSEEESLYPPAGKHKTTKTTTPSSPSTPSSQLHDNYPEEPEQTTPSPPPPLTPGSPEIGGGGNVTITTPSGGTIQVPWDQGPLTEPTQTQTQSQGPGATTQTPTQPGATNQRGRIIGSLTKMWNGTNCSRATNRPSCRREGAIPEGYEKGNYGIRATVKLGGKIDNGGKGHGSAGTEITAGGPGSEPGLCCGLTMGVHNDSAVNSIHVTKNVNKLVVMMVPK
jgi:hypothetical protein